MPVVKTFEAYAKTSVAGADAARRFETTSLILSYAFIRVSVENQDFGDSATQPVTITTGAGVDFIILKNIDISTLYFKNSGAGDNGTVTIVGVKATNS